MTEDDIINLLNIHGNSVVSNTLVKMYGKRKAEARLSEKAGYKVRIETHIIEDDNFIELNHQSKRKGPQIGYVTYRVKK